jgi:hypothetical protein
METLTKNIFLRSFLIFLIATTFMLIFERNAEAKFIKKLIVEPFTSPIGWEKSFNIGVFFSSMLEKSLAKSGDFQMVQFEEKISAINNNDQPQTINENDQPKINIKEKKNEKVKEVISVNQLNLNYLRKTPLSQYKIKGNILIFNPDTHRIKKDQDKKQEKFHKERALIQVNIELLNSHTGRLFVKKIFTVKSNQGRKPFNLKSLNSNFKSDNLKVHSVGKALIELNHKVKIFIHKSLNRVPLEGDLILIDHSNNIAIINLGKANGVNVRDVFTVFSVESKFNDPVDEVDLGDMYLRKGIIKISEVQGRFSKAQIIAGEKFVPGDLVVPKYSKLENLRNNEQSKESDITWGAYKGLPSLSY